MPVTAETFVAVLVGGVALALLVASARETVGRLVAVACHYEVSEAVVGLTVLASAYVALAVLELLVANLRLGGSMVGVITLGVGSALPELTTFVESIRNETPTLALGTLVGSNVVNPLVAVGLGGAISTYRVPAPVVFWDLPAMVVCGASVFVYVTRVTDGRLSRHDATALVMAYFAFVSGRLLLFAGQ